MVVEKSVKEAIGDYVSTISSKIGSTISRTIGSTSSCTIGSTIGSTMSQPLDGIVDDVAATAICDVLLPAVDCVKR